MEKKLVFVINGYGCHEDTPLGNIYLPRMKRFRDENLDRLIATIFTGGETQKKTAPGKTEARVMAEWFSRQMGLGGQIPPDWYLEEDSYTSWDNSESSSLWIGRIVNNKQPPPFQIVHGCEAQRAPVVTLLDRYHMLRWVESIDDLAVETASWERADPLLQATNLIMANEMIKNRDLAVAESNARRRRSHEI